MSSRRRTVLAAAGVGALSVVGARPALAGAVDPYSSGAIGAWRTFSHVSSPVSTDRLVAGDALGVRLVGDSIGRGLLTTLRAVLVERDRPLSWDTWPGRPTGPAVDALRRSVAAGLVPHTLVVVSGANDVFAPAAFEPALERLLAYVGPDRQVHWVTPSVQRRRSPAADIRNTALVGLALERAAARHRNLHLVRWFEFLAARPSSRLPAYLVDGVHPSTSGYAALARLVCASLDAD